jgi:hypothetical protein
VKLYFSPTQALPNSDEAGYERAIHIDGMKRFFSKSSKNQPSTPAVSTPTHDDLVVHTPVLPPKFVVPPVPYPRPHDHIAILSTQDGLLLRPYVTRQDESDHYVRITWGKLPEIEELRGATQNASVNWGAAVVVYGIVGILELFTGSLSSQFFSDLS